MSTAPAIRVVLVDGHPTVLMSGAMVLEQPGIHVIGATPDLDFATRLCLSDRADVVVIDPHVRAGSSRATVAALRLQLPQIAIVVMNMESSPTFARVALRAGANGYVLKSEADIDLPEAVTQVAAGQQFVSPALAMRADAGRVARAE